MIRPILICTFLCILSTAGNACELCGCSTGNYYFGILPGLKSRFISIRYNFIHYETRLTSDPTQFSKDNYRAVEIWGGWNIGSRWQLMGMFPYQINKRETDDGSKQTHGLGDISLITKYSLLHTRTPGKKDIENQFWLGGGIKLPTGSYHIDLTAPGANIGDINSTAGTGSLDFLAMAIHSLRLRNTGLNTSILYKANTTNAEQYRFGNRLIVNSLFYYHIQSTGFSLSPNAGLQYQHSEPNVYSHIKIDQTGGYLVNADLGLEFQCKRLAIGLTTQWPVAQNLSDGQTVSKIRGILHTSLTF